MLVFVDHLLALADGFVVVTVVYMQPFGSCVFLLIICVRLRTGLWWCLHLHKPVRRRTQTINKHYMNQMIAYKQQLEIPLMMGL
jgi:hypothetical protein